jgi:hypothetical protein
MGMLLRVSCPGIPSRALDKLSARQLPAPPWLATWCLKLVAAGAGLLLLASAGAATNAASSALGLEPGDLRLCNDDLGIILWGPDSAPTLSVGKSDVWDRRNPKPAPFGISFLKGGASLPIVGG